MARKKLLDKQFRDLTEEIDLERFRDSIKSNFADFPDERKTAQCFYPAWYLILILLCGYLAGGNTLEEIAHFAQLRANWFEMLFGKDIGIPSYNTLWWFISRTKPYAFKSLIAKWLHGLPSDLCDQLLTIDGKRLKGVSRDSHITHLVELFIAENQLVIAQEKVPDKTWECTALPALLGSVNVKGAIISMDALYAHIQDLRLIIASGADYIVGIKGNQPLLEAEVTNFFEQARSVNYEEVGASHFETHDKEHGRIDSRYVSVVNDLEWLPQQEECGLQSLTILERYKKAYPELAQKKL